MIIAMLQKIQDKCPLKYAVARFASSISPSQMVGHKEKCDETSYMQAVGYHPKPQI